MWLQTNEIKRTDVRGGAVLGVADSGAARPRALALDWAARTLYYSAAGALAAARLHGQHTARLPAPAHGNITALAVHPLQ